MISPARSGQSDRS